MKSLLTKLLAAHLLTILLAFGLLALLLHQVLYPYYINKIIGGPLISRGEMLAVKIAPLLVAGNTKVLNQHLEWAKAGMGAEICLVGTNSKIVAHAAPSGAWVKEEPITTCCENLKLTGPGLTIRSANMTACQRDMLIATVPVYRPGEEELAGEPVLNELGDGIGAEAIANNSNATSLPKPIAGLLIRLPISEINDAAGQLSKVIYLCGLAGALFALLMAIVLSARIAGPLRKMRGMAAGIVKGDFEGRIRVKSRDEVGQLAGSFNTMAEKLQDSLASLEGESAKLRGVLSSMAEGVLAVGEDEHIMLANPQIFALLNLPQKELVGQALSEAALPEALTTAFQHCLKDRCMVSAEINVPAAWDAEQLSIISELGTVAIHAVPMHLGSDNWGVVGVIRDVSEAHRMETMRRRFFSDISHELRTPLTNIVGYATALSDGTADDMNVRALALSVILKESDRLQRFINDLLDLSRLESGEPGLHKEWCDVGQIAAATADSIGAVASQAKVALHFDMAKDLPQVFADPDRIAQVLSNLFVNAIHFNHPNGEIMVSVSAVPTELRVIVKDTGIGIAAEELPHVWERFHRVAETSPTAAEEAPISNQGTGLGLAIVRSIIQGHGGRVWAESIPGQGSTFGFALPVG